ncbi:hypothetical protein OF83DRAFT_1120093 [Amylostereum chailletii]|nr:hypothetical protein OF83DRAFT_1120093 [Amylostereum chailletii]
MFTPARPLWYPMGVSNISCGPDHCTPIYVYSTCPGWGLLHSNSSYAAMDLARQDTLYLHRTFDGVTMSLPLSALGDAARSSKDFDHTVRALIQSEVFSALSQFVTAPTRFRNVLRSSKAVIGGSFALHIALRAGTTWRPANLDIYCPYKTFPSMIKLLVDTEGYAIMAMTASGHPSSPDFKNDIVTAFSLIRVHDNTQVAVYSTTNPSPLPAITRAWATHLVNFVTADSVCVAYPVLTLDGHSRGMEVHKFCGASPSHFSGQPSPYCPHYVRKFGDDACLTVYFGDDDVAKDDLVWDDEVSWRWGGSDGCGDGCELSTERMIDVKVELFM